MKGVENDYMVHSQVVSLLDISIQWVPRKVLSLINQINIRMGSLDIHFLTDESG